MSRNQYDDHMRGEDPDGVNNYSPQANILFQTDMEQANGTLNGFDDVRESENGGSTTITYVDDGAGSQVAQFNLIAGGFQDVWLRENFGDYLGQSTAQDDIWLRFRWRVSNLNALNPSSTNKVCTIQFSDGVSTTRTYQIIITAIDMGGGHVFRLEHLWFTNGSWAGDEWFGSYTTDTITAGEWCYLKLHVVNSTAGNSDGSVDLWFDDTLVVSAQNVSISGSTGDSPNSLIFGTYNGSQASTVNGYVQYDDVLLQDQDPGAWAPAQSGTIPTWRGLVDAGAQANLSSADAIGDFREDISTNYPGLLWVDRGATQTYVSTGGYLGGGFNRFTPNYSETWMRCGLGEIHNFQGVGDSSRVNIGLLVRWGAGFIPSWMKESTKFFLLVRDPNTSGVYERPMTINKGGTLTKVLAPANGTVANTTSDPYNNPLTYNGNNSEPDINLLGNVWCWLEFQVDCNGPDGTITLKTWSADSRYQGDFLMQLMTNGEGAETFGGVINNVNIIGWLEQAAAPGTVPADPSYDLEYMRIVTGSTADITPPPGFPGHNSANW